MTFLREFLHDSRYAARVVARQPGTTLIIIFSLALGIGANTMVFSLVNAILLRSLPYPQPDRLVQLWFTPPDRPNQRGRANAGICMDLPTRDSLFTAAGCYIGVAGNVADPEDALTTGPEWLEGEMLTYHAVHALGVTPVVGRWFTQAEDHGDAEKVMLVSYDLWQRLGGSGGFAFTIAGRVPPSERDMPGARWLPVGADYFKVLRVPLVRGREFSDLDTIRTPPIAIINETMAKRYWPNEDPIGQTISIQFYNDQPRQIVGIVPDIRPNLRNRDPEPQMYVPHAQLPTIQAGITAFGLENVTFVVRSRARLEDWLPSARATASELDPAHAINTVQLVSAFAAQQTQGFRQYVILLGAFSGIALLLAVVGIYGVMSHSVTQRTNEIGIRVAFGASARNVLASVLGRGLKVIGIGTAIGLVASLSLTRIIEGSLWGVTSTDPTTYSVVLVTLLIVACLACYVPARRALKVDPLVAMRRD